MSPRLALAGVVLGGALDEAAIIVVSLLVAVPVFVATVVAQWVLLLGSGARLAHATELWRAGDTRTPVAICQRPLAWVVRADVRTRALYVLGLCAQANGDFAESADLFARASAMVPAFAASKWQRHARVLALSHRAIALVALHLPGEADAAVREASRIFPQAPSTGLDALTDDVAFGAGLLPREHALVGRVEARARHALGGGPMRVGAMAPHASGDPAGVAWADRILAGPS